MLTLTARLIFLTVMLVVLMFAATAAPSFKVTGLALERFESQGGPVVVGPDQASMVNARLGELTKTLNYLVENNSAAVRWGGYDDLQKRITKVEVTSAHEIQNLEAAQLAAAIRIDTLNSRLEQAQASLANASGATGNIAAQVGTVTDHMDKLMATVSTIGNDITQFSLWKDVINDAERINKGIRAKLSGSTTDRAVIVPSSNTGFLAIDATVPNKTHFMRAADHHELVVGQMDDAGAPLPGGYDLAIDGDPGTHRAVVLGPLGGGTMPTAALAARQGVSGQGGELLLASLEPTRQVRHFGARHVFDVNTGRMATTQAPYTGTSHIHGNMLSATEVGPNRKTALTIDADGVHLDRHTLKSTPEGDLLVCDRQSPDKCQTVFNHSM